MPVYLALQLAGCAAPPVAGRTGGLLPRLFTLAAPAEGRAVVFCHTCPDVAAGFPLGNAMLFVARTFLFMLAHRATDLISVFCKVTEIFPDVQIGRANSDTFDGENVGLIFSKPYSHRFCSVLSVFVQYVDNQGQDSCRGAAGGVDAEMVIGGMSPAAVGKVIVV